MRASSLSKKPDPSTFILTVESVVLAEIVKASAPFAR